MLWSIAFAKGDMIAVRDGDYYRFPLGVGAPLAGVDLEAVEVGDS
jgi:hypothetical protein